MKKFELKLSDKTHETLKDFARKDYRSMQQYIELVLSYIASQEYKPAPTPLSNPEMEGYALPLPTYNKKGEE